MTLHGTTHGTAPGDGPAAEPQVLSRGGFKLVNGQRKLLRQAGIESDVVCPPGVDPNQ
ncbi:MAG: hypothetical protein AAGB93_10190 [Planctomycetota bacterium]